MDNAPNTVFLRLEAPLQSWGDNSKYVIRRTMEAPTKSGVLGLICCAMGVSREAAGEVLPELNKLAMGVRTDREGIRWWDYHTVGAKVGVLTAEGKVKITQSTGDIETVVSRREYLCDASFLVALQGETDVVRRVAQALDSPRWPIFLGRRSCPPGVPVFQGAATCANLAEALALMPWRPRSRWERAGQSKSRSLPCLLEWRPSRDQPTAPEDAETWYDTPVFFDPPVHQPRLIVRGQVTVAVGEELQKPMPAPPRPRADYRNAEYRRVRDVRLDADHGVCVFCKAPATTVQHVTYRRAGGGEQPDDLRSLCRLCHDAVTMIEYGRGMGLDRIDPEDPCWRDRITTKRREIIQFRSLETRRRRLAAEEVE